MKLKYKKYLYVLGYLLPILILGILSYTSYVKDWEIPFSVAFYPHVFIFLDGILLFLVMHNLKKEKYHFQIKILNYFKGWNNIILFFIIIFGSKMSVFMGLFDLFIHLVIYFILKPMPVNDEEVNGVEEFFNKYPERNKHKFYKNVDEIKKEYAPIKKEVEIEIPVMDVKAKEQKQAKRKKIIGIFVPILIILMIVFGILFKIVEDNVKYNRGNFHYFDLNLNGQGLPIYYQQSYNKVIVRYFYEQSSYNDSYEINGYSLDDILVDVQKSDKYIINLNEYVCWDDDIKVPCYSSNIKNKKLSPLSKSTLTIKKSIDLNNKDISNIDIKDSATKIIYEGSYKEDISQYISDSGIYVLIFENKGDNIQNEITAIINITEEKMIEN